MASIQSLPVELLRTIFILSVVNPSKRPPDHRPVCLIDSVERRKHLTIPLTLSYTCRQWRSVTLDMGHLWSTVNIPLNHDLTPTEMSMTLWHMKRAGSFPLDLTVSASLDIEKEPQDTLIQLWEFVLNCLPHCQSLTFPDLPQSTYQKMFPISCPLPQLRHISINIKYSLLATLHFALTPPVPWNSLFDNADRAPSLESLHMHDPRLYMLDKMPLPALQKLWMSRIQPSQSSHLWSILRQCTALKDLHLPSIISRGAFPYPESPLPLPSLEKLFLHDCDLDRLIIAPRLRNLTCFNYRGGLNRSHIPSIHEITLIIEPQIAPFTFQWSPPEWMRDVEKLTFGILPADLRATLTALQENEKLVPSVGVEFRNLPNLKHLAFDSPGFPFTGPHVQDSECELVAMNDIAAILELRDSLHVQVHGSMHMPEDQWAGLSARFSGRISTIASGM